MSPFLFSPRKKWREGNTNQSENRRSLNKMEACVTHDKWAPNHQRHQKLADPTGTLRTLWLQRKPEENHIDTTTTVPRVSGEPTAPLELTLRQEPHERPSFL